MWIAANDCHELCAFTISKCGQDGSSGNVTQAYDGETDFCFRGHERFFAKQIRAESLVEKRRKLHRIHLRQRLTFAVCSP